MTGMFVNVWNDSRHSFSLPSHAQWSEVLRHALLRGRMGLALAPPRSPMGFALRAACRPIFLYGMAARL